MAGSVEVQTLSDFVSEASRRLAGAGWRRHAAWFAGEIGRICRSDVVLIYENFTDRDRHWTAVRVHAWRGAALDPDDLLPAIVHYADAPQFESLLTRQQPVWHEPNESTPCCCVPVIRGDHSWGFLATNVRRASDRTDVEYALFLAARALGTALRETELIERLRESDRLRTVQRQLATASVTDRPWSEAMTDLLAILCESTGFDSASIEAIRGGETVRLAVRGLPADREMLCEQCASELNVGAINGPAYLTGAGMSHSGPCSLHRTAQHAAALVPLVHHGALIGTLFFGSSSRSEVPANARSVIESAAADVATLLAHEEADRLLRATSERHRLAADAGRVGIWEYEERSDLMLLEPIAAELLDLGSLRTVQIDTALAALDAEAREAIHRWFDLDASGSRGLHVEARIGTGARWVLVRARRARSDDRGQAVVGTILDITDQKAAHEAADALTRAQSEFIARMSHEFRTPLHAIQGHLQLLRRGVDPADHEMDDSLRGVESAASHLLVLVESLLDHNKIESGTLGIDAHPVDLPELFQDLEEMTRVLGVHAGTSSQIVVSGDPPGSALLDAVRVRQVLYNLIANAVKYSPGGHVTVSVRWTAGLDSDHDRIRFAVSDDGPGIPPDQRGRVFLPFRGNPDRGGSGLGLAISQELVQLMGSRIWLASMPDQGSTFWFSVSAPTAVAVREPEARADLLYPEPSRIGPLVDLAKIGDLESIREQIATVRADEGDPAEEFFAELDRLASKYRVREVRTLLEAAMEHA